MTPDEPAPMAGEAEASPASPLWAWRVALVLAVVLPVLAAFLAFAHQDMPSAIADLFIGEAARAVPDGHGGIVWEPAQLPYHCNEAGAGPDAVSGCTATLRVTFLHDPGDQRPWSLYVPSYQGAVGVSLNGTFLASSTWQQSPVAFAIVPILVPLPATLVRPGVNVIDFAVTRRGMVAGFLGWIAIGPDERLRPQYEARRFVVTTLAQFITAGQVIMGLALLLIWLARRQDSVYLVAGVVLLFHAAATLPTLLGGGIDPWDAKLANHARLVAIGLLPPLAWLFIGRKPPIPIAAFLVLPVVSISSFLVLPPDMHAKGLAIAVIPFGFLHALAALLVVLNAAFRERSTAAMFLCAAVLVSVVFSIQSFLLMPRTFAANASPLVIFTAPTYMAVIGAMLIWRFAQAMNAQDRFSARLKNAVTAAEGALRRSFAREQAQARMIVLETERVRLMSDLHDGIAGQLVSILALCELRGTQSDEVAGAVRAALADLRLVIASLEDSGDDLGVMLAMFRERIEPQLAAFGIRLAWRMEPLPHVAGLQPGTTLNIFRILQEAAINAARHSGSPVLGLEAIPSPKPGCSVRLTVRDQGRGGVARRPGSHGLDNIRRRARVLGAELHIESNSAGTTVTLDLPTQLSSPS